MNDTVTEVHVFVNRRRVELESGEYTGATLLSKFGFTGDSWDLFLLQGEGDPTGGKLIHFNEQITVKNGEHFRVIPGNATFGAPVAPTVSVLEQHAAVLMENTGLKVDLVIEGSRRFVIIRSVPLPPGRFTVHVTDVLLIADDLYPLSAMDMFWTGVEVVRADGSIPRNADSIETYNGMQWRRFSWHRNGAWNVSGNPLLDHFAFVEARWEAEVAE